MARRPASTNQAVPLSVPVSSNRKLSGSIRSVGPSRTTDTIVVSGGVTSMTSHSYTAGDRSMTRVPSMYRKSFIAWTSNVYCI
jgi:hypothetical protein